MMTKKEERRDEDGRPTDHRSTSNKQQVSNQQKQPKTTKAYSVAILVVVIQRHCFASHQSNHDIEANTQMSFIE